MRLLCVLAVLAGLFGMHGMSAPDGAGCHGGAAMAAMSHQPMSDAPVVAHNATGGSCVFVQPASWPAPELVPLGIVVLGATALLTLRWWRTDRSRSPPDAGTALLHRLCVSLT